MAGEITTTAYVDIPKLVRQTISEIGYDREAYGFDGNTCGVVVASTSSPPTSARASTTPCEVRTGTSGEDILNAQGAGDQGMMFGYACDETDDLMPLPIWLAHRLAQRLAEVRKAEKLPYLRPDGKTQVTFDYEDGRPVADLGPSSSRPSTAPGIDRSGQLLPDLIEHVIGPVVPDQFADDGYEVLVNPTGSFELGGPHADAGLTGRKIIVDTYGGAARHGGGAFSGKDPSKVDRSAAYAARWVAKHVVAVGRGAPLRGAGGLRHRRGPAGVDHGRDVRHRDGRPGQDRAGRAAGLRPPPGRHHPRPRPAPADLPAHRRLRPLRSHRRRVHLGVTSRLDEFTVGAGDSEQGVAPHPCPGGRGVS